MTVSSGVLDAEPEFNEPADANDAILTSGNNTDEDITNENDAKKIRLLGEFAVRLYSLLKNAKKTTHSIEFQQQIPSANNEEEASANSEAVVQPSEASEGEEENEEANGEYYSSYPTDDSAAAADEANYDTTEEINDSSNNFYPNLNDLYRTHVDLIDLIDMKDLLEEEEEEDEDEDEEDETDEEGDYAPPANVASAAADAGAGATTLFTFLLPTYLGMWNMFLERGEPVGQIHGMIVATVLFFCASYFNEVGESLELFLCARHLCFDIVQGMFWLSPNTEFFRFISRGIRGETLLRLAMDGAKQLIDCIWTKIPEETRRETVDTDLSVDDYMTMATYVISYVYK